MNVRVGAIEVTQRLLDSPWLCLEEEPIVPASDSGTCYSQPKLERHVEAWSQGRGAVELDAGKIVNRIPAALDEREDALKPTLAARYAERDTRLQTEVVEPDGLLLGLEEAPRGIPSPLASPAVPNDVCPSLAAQAAREIPTRTANSRYLALRRPFLPMLSSNASLLSIYRGSQSIESVQIGWA